MTPEQRSRRFSTEEVERLAGLVASTEGAQPTITLHLRLGPLDSAPAATGQSQDVTAVIGN
jgi:hypothetical protein